MQEIAVCICVQLCSEIRLNRSRDTGTGDSELYDETVPQDTVYADDESAMTSAKSSVFDGPSAAASSATSFSLTYNRQADRYNEEQLAHALLYNDMCKSALNALAASGRKDHFERSVATVLELLAWDFREYADGQEELALFQCLLQQYELIAASIASAITLPDQQQRVKGVQGAHAMGSEDHALDSLMKSPAVTLFVERIYQLRRTTEASPQRKPDTIKKVSAAYQCVGKAKSSGQLCVLSVVRLADW